MASDAAYHRAYRAANAEKLAVRRKAYVKAHPAEIAKYQQEYRKIHAKETSVKMKKFYADNRESILATRKKYYAANSEAVRTRVSEYVRKNRKKINVYLATRRKTDPVFKLCTTLRARIYKAIQFQGVLKPSKTIAELGCTPMQLRDYLEMKFVPGMTWSNHGEWHVDHVRPLASFDLADPKQFAEACHHTNLQPLWAEENMRKGCKMGKKLLA